MDLRPEGEELFMEIFNQVRQEIKSQKGCLSLELLRSTENGLLNLWTISLWHSADDLETYRNSALFRKTWFAIKPLFAGKAQAWTLTSIDSLK
jgi:heme-degrading monooxygenase HmoA